MPIIRRAKPQDLPALLAMVQGLALHHQDTPLVTMDSLRRDMFGPVLWFHVLVAENDGPCLGYAALLPLARLQYGQRGMDLHHLYVEQSARGGGIGQALVTAALQHARGLGCSYFTVGSSAGNDAAHRFYRRMGFADRPLEGRRFSLDLEDNDPTTAPSPPATTARPGG